LTSFIGRTADAAEVAVLLDQYRLAAEVARQVAACFADGEWLVELASVQEPALLQAAVATVLGLQQAPGTSILDSLIALLTRQQLLLVMDNCEHMLAAAAELGGRCCPLRTMCGSWRPAASRSAWPGRPATGCLGAAAPSVASNMTAACGRDGGWLGREHDATAGVMATFRIACQLAYAALDRCLFGVVGLGPVDVLPPG
jgi:hypothetical protein